jgi:hypothetical protein
MRAPDETQCRLAEIPRQRQLVEIPERYTLGLLDEPIAAAHAIRALVQHERK